MSPADVFAMFGGKEWDDFRDRFKSPQAAE